MGDVSGYILFISFTPRPGCKADHTVGSVDKAFRATLTALSKAAGVETSPLTQRRVQRHHGGNESTQRTSYSALRPKDTRVILNSGLGALA